MADVVNLRLARKRKSRTDKERLAEQNRSLHGRSKAERANDLKIRQQAEKFIDGHRRASDDDGDQ